MICRIALAAALLGAAPATLLSQSTAAYTVRVDNDAFNFWRPAWDRPDEEYTSGVRLILAHPRAPRWGKYVWKDAEPCGATSQTCVVTSTWIGQDIYNPARDTKQRQIRRSRPNAGWLYLAQEIRKVSARDAESLRLTLGVTGPPSMGALTQELAHSAAPHLNRPIDWSTQIGFEPGILARYEREAMVLDGRAKMLGAQVLPGASVSVGNVRTEASGSLRARAGLWLDNPWLARISGTGGELALSAGATGRAVARDLFLDGNTFRAGPRVPHKPFVLERHAGISVRFEELRLEYNVNWTGPTYRGGPSHVWSSMVGGLVFIR